MMHIAETYNKEICYLPVDAECRDIHLNHIKHLVGKDIEVDWKEYVRQTNSHDIIVDDVDVPIWALNFYNSVLNKAK